MSTHNREDILPTTLEFTQISLISTKIKILIIGGGKAGYIKSKSFATKKCNVEIVAPNFIREFDELIHMNNVKIIKGSYNSNMILNKHLIVIAVNDYSLSKQIQNDCEKNFKLYLNCSDFNEGLYIMPVQKETKNISFSVHTKEGSPKTSLFLSKIIEQKLKNYDDFVKYTCNIRNQIKNYKNKTAMLNFINQEDFKFFYDKGVHNDVLMMFFDDLKF